MSDVFGVLGNIKQVYEIIHWAVEVYKGIKGAPQAVLEMTGEVECLITCLNAFNYTECRSALLEASDDQQRDFSTILEGCKLNVVEIKTFVAECQIIMKATDAAYKKKQKKKGLPTQLLNKVKNMWHGYKFFKTDKQPMRDKLAIPLHSLNVFLVSLTFSRMSLGTGLSSSTPVAPKNWAVIGSMISFKEAKFTSADLIKPGTEERIYEAAHSVIYGHRCVGHCCPCCTCSADACHCDDDDDGASTILSTTMKSPGPGRKYSSNKGKLVSDKMYLVRSKSKQRGRSKSVVRRVKREVFPTNSGNTSGRQVSDDEIDESLAGDLIDSDDSFPRVTPSYLGIPTAAPPRSRRVPSPNPDNQRSSYEPHDRGRRHHRQSSPMPDSDHHPHQHPHRPRISEADIERARREARETATDEIREVRRQARGELELGVEITEREVSRRSRRYDDAPPEPVDVRRYMELRYGIMIDRATSQEREAAEGAESLREVSEQLRSMSERRSRTTFETRHHHPRHERERATETVFDEFDLHISEDSDDEPEPTFDLEPEIVFIRERHSIPSRPERTYTRTRTRNCFVIPDTDYEPVTTTLPERRTEARRREESARHDSAREEELSRRAEHLLEREATLYEREAALRAREREFDERSRMYRVRERERPRPDESEHDRGEIYMERLADGAPRRPSAQIRRRHTEVPHDPSIEIHRQEEEEVVDDGVERHRRRQVRDPRTRQMEDLGGERVIEIMPRMHESEGEGVELHSTESEEEEFRVSREPGPGPEVERERERARRRIVMEDPETRSRRVRRRRSSS